MARRRVLIADRNAEIGLAVVLIVAGSYLLHDAFENRGRPRPFAAKLLPGP